MLESQVNYILGLSAPTTTASTPGTTIPSFTGVTTITLYDKDGNPVTLKM